MIPTQSMHIEALILAFSHSAASTLVGTDALRTVISGQYRDMITAAGFELQPLWLLLESQPGFDAMKVKPPLCRFKTWEHDLEIPVVLPLDLGELDSVNIHALADECRVPSGELDRVLERGKYTREARQQRAAKWTADPDHPEVRELDVQSNARPLLLALVSLVAVAAFGAAGFFLYSSFGSGSWSDVSTAVATDIPNVKATRLGMDVTMTLTSDAWLSAPEEQRRRNLLDLITRLARDGVANIVVRDTSGKIRATAQKTTSGPVKIRLL